MTIEAYLAELRRALPWTPQMRDRILAEVEDHLNESARTIGEEEAVSHFGSVSEVARPYSSQIFVRRAVLAMLAAIAFPVLTYPLPENTLPPAPWPNVDAMPFELAWKREAIMWLFVLAVGAGLVALAGLPRRGTLLVGATAVGLVALGQMALLGSVLSVEWAGYVVGEPKALLLLGPLQLLLVLAGAVFLTRGALLSRA